MPSFHAYPIEKGNGPVRRGGSCTSRAERKDRGCGCGLCKKSMQRARNRASLIL